GQRQRALALDDAALPELLRRPLVLLHHVDLLDQHAPADRQHAQHFAALAALPAGDDRNRVAPSHVRVWHQMTSGASEMILVNWRSRSSRATGPKMRVPTGFSSGLIRTTALRSKRMYDPSRRRTSLTVRTTTARATSPFLTVPSGVGLVVRLQLLRRSDDALVARMAEHPLDPYHARLLHRVRHDHAFTTLPLTHGLRLSSRGARCSPAPDPSSPGSAAKGSWPP